MAREARELKFLATPEKGEVSALLIRPGGRRQMAPSAARALMSASL